MELYSKGHAGKEVNETMTIMAERDKLKLQLATANAAAGHFMELWGQEKAKVKELRAEILGVATALWQGDEEKAKLQAVFNSLAPTNSKGYEGLLATGQRLIDLDAQLATANRQIIDLKSALKTSVKK